MMGAQSIAIRTGGPAAPTAVGTVILVVDDEPGIRSLISRALSRLGFVPLLAADGTEALRLFDAHAPDIGLVLLDWHMPGLSGQATLAALLARRADLRVILVTGSAEATTNERATADSVSILLKPFTPATLAMAVRSVLGA